MKKILVVLMVLMVAVASLSAQEEAPSAGVTVSLDVGLSDIGGVAQEAYIYPTFDFTTSTGIASFSAYGDATVSLTNLGISVYTVGLSGAFEFDLGGATLTPSISFDVVPLGLFSLVSSDIGLSLGVGDFSVDLTGTVTYVDPLGFELALEPALTVDIVSFYINGGLDFADEIAFTGIGWGVSVDLGDGVSLYTDGEVDGGFSSYGQSIGVSVSY